MTVFDCAILELDRFAGALESEEKECRVDWIGCMRGDDVAEEGCEGGRTSYDWAT
jgi:hypothetical protein